MPNIIEITDIAAPRLDPYVRLTEAQLKNRLHPEDGLFDVLSESGVGSIAYVPLAQGLLTDRYLDGIPADSRIARDGRFLKESSLTSERLSQIRALNDIARERGQTLAEMALAWILKDGDVCSVLIGASRPKQILDNVRAIQNCAFTEEELRRIDAICG